MNNNNNKERERLIHLSLQGCDYESFELDQVDSLLLLSMEEICQEEEGGKERESFEAKHFSQYFHLPFLNLFLFFALLFRKFFTEDLELMKREFNVVLDLQCSDTQSLTQMPISAHSLNTQPFPSKTKLTNVYILPYS